MKRRQFIGACALPFLATRTGNLLSAQRMVPAGAAIDLSTGVFRRRFTGFGGETPLWGYNGTTPGPLLRFRRGETVTIDVANSLPESTTVHWHGVRVPHAMDGVPHITQPPIKPGERFRYQFAVPDSGTYWYHPHHRSFEQVGRGLFGGLIVEEEKPIEVDRDVAWLIADLLLDPASGAHAPFGRISEHAAEGRLGNLITINGEVSGPDHFMDVRAGERIRMRLINAATARVFRLRFDRHVPTVIAYDGQAITPHVPDGSSVLLGPGMRADLVIDCEGRPGERFAIDDAVSGKVLATLRYRDEDMLRSRLRGAPLQLARNELPVPNLKKPTTHTIEFRGGSYGPPAIGMVDGKAIPLHEMQNKHGLAWTVNSHALAEDAHEVAPLLTLKQGSTHVINMINGTGFVHPMHLHGHFFRVLDYNGVKPKHEEWRDTVFMHPWDEVTIAVVAGEPGDWMFHCHILEHAAAGMMGVIRVE